jgi:hypothetical protein
MHAAGSPAGPQHVKPTEHGAFITTCYYHKSAIYYSRTMAVSVRRSMLFSGGDFPGTLSSILSGEGFDEGEQGNRRFSFSPTHQTP